MNITVYLSTFSPVITAIFQVDLIVDEDLFLPFLYKGVINLLASIKERLYSLNYEINPNVNGVRLTMTDSQVLVETNLDRDSAVALIDSLKSCGVISVDLQCTTLLF